MGESYKSNMLSGIVTKGLGLAGKTFGVPTANIQLISPAELGPGTYAGYAMWANQLYPAMIYYGQNTQLKLEVHLLNFDGNLYGARLSADPRAKIADYTPWVNVETMKEKITEDLARVNAWFEAQKSIT
jgi:riboflavin kinase/FMN adenylyltransferase